MKITTVFKALVCSIGLSSLPCWGAQQTLQDFASQLKPLPAATIYVAKEIVTLNPDKPQATAVAVVGDRILATGTLEELHKAAGEQAYTVDTTFANKVIVPGFIAQHDHPLLSGLTMISEIISIEDWNLPTGFFPKAKDADDYRKRLQEANAKLKDPNQQLLTWGYHQAFHGPLNRADLDAISSTRSIVVWHRSCHEFFLNSKALETTGITSDFVKSLPEGARAMINYQEGHFWEQGMFAILNKLLPTLASPERFQAGLQAVSQYYHSNGITVGCEPGGIYSKQIQDAENAVMSRTDSPFRFYFIPDGKSIYTMFPDTATAETEKTLSWGQGMTVVPPLQIKLFADGAIYSLAMQLREPYLGDFHGAWIMDPDLFAKAFRTYWDAGYQIHVHVNGDKGLDMLLDNLEINMRRHPRYDHRMVVVHFAVSQKDQVERIKRLGAIVSGNPYYVTALADKYSEVGLGPDRADNMVRLGDVERAGIPFSLHADMPMAPSQPLFLMDCAVNRVTVSGRVAGDEQRVSREAALKAVTLEAAYSLNLEKEIGSIVAGKLANFTILNENPVTCPEEHIKDIGIWGTIHEGRKLPLSDAPSGQTSLGPRASDATYLAMEMDAIAHADSHKEHTDICTLNHVFGIIYAEMLRN